MVKYFMGRILALVAVSMSLINFSTAADNFEKITFKKLNIYLLNLDENIYAKILLAESLSDFYREAIERCRGTEPNVFAACARDAAGKSRSIGTSNSLFVSDFYRLSGALGVINGGYMRSFSPPRALGLVRADRITWSRPHKSWLIPGLLCTNSSGALEISKYTNGSEKFSELDCIQAGPMLVEDGVSLYLTPPANRAERYLVGSKQWQTFACVKRSGVGVLGISEPMTIYELSEFLSRFLQCKVSIRLSGQETSGLVHSGTVYGNNSLPIYDAIGVFSRQATSAE